MAWARTRGERVSAGAGEGAGWRWGTGGWGALTAEDVHKMCGDVYKLPEDVREGVHKLRDRRRLRNRSHYTLIWLVSGPVTVLFFVTPVQACNRACINQKTNKTHRRTHRPVSGHVSIQHTESTTPGKRASYMPPMNRANCMRQKSIMRSETFL